MDAEVQTELNKLKELIINAIPVEQISSLSTVNPRCASREDTSPASFSGLASLPSEAVYKLFPITKAYFFGASS